MMQAFAKSRHSVFKCSFPLLRGVQKRLKGKGSIHHKTDSNFAEMLMKTHRVSEFSFYSSVLTWYLGKRREGDDDTPTTHLNLSQ